MFRNAIIAIALLAGSAAADEREGYYYPPIVSEEVFARELVASGPPADRAVRVRFITQVTKAQLAAPENPPFVIFAKGAEAEHMIIIALDDAIFRTLYRARAVLAQLTANLRGTQFFVESGLDVEGTWFDLAKLLGFEDVVISDGAEWAHRVVLR